MSDDSFFALILGLVLIVALLVAVGWEVIHGDECEPQELGQLRGSSWGGEYSHVDNVEFCDGQHWRPYRVPVKGR